MYIEGYFEGDFAKARDILITAIQSIGDGPKFNTCTIFTSHGWYQVNKHTGLLKQDIQRRLEELYRR